MHIANILTFIRLLLVPVFASALGSGHFALGFWLFIVASLTDICDGYMARKYNLTSSFGELVDPLADKVLMICAALVLSRFEGITIALPEYLAGLIILRDMVMIGIGAMLYIHPKTTHVRATKIGKISTIIQIVCLSAYIFVNAWPASSFGHFLSFLLLPLAWLTAFTTLASGLIYFLDAKKLNREQAQSI